jgi:hypothetical protein
MARRRVVAMFTAWDSFGIEFRKGEGKCPVM